MATVFRIAAILFLLCLAQSFSVRAIAAPAHVTISKNSASKPPSTSAKPSMAAEKGPKIKCWYFVQTNMIFGDCEVYASPKALKITFSNQKWANLAKSPDWDLFVFNPKAKIYCRTPLKDWRARKLGSSFVKGLKPLAKDEIIAGMRTKVYDAESFEKTTPRSRIFLVEGLNLPQQISIILCGNDALPELKGIPFRVQHMGGEGPGKTIETHVAKQMEVPAGFFDMPIGYRQTKKPEDVITGGISDIIEEMAR